MLLLIIIIIIIYVIIHKKIRATHTIIIQQSYMCVSCARLYVTHHFVNQCGQIDKHHNHHDYLKEN